MYTAQLPDKGPFVIRYPRGRGSLVDWTCPLEEAPVGTGRKLKEGKDMAVISIGPIGTVSAKAIARAEAEADRVTIAHYDLRYLKPLDENLLNEIGQKFSKVITVEDGVTEGGMGSSVLEFMSDHNYTPQVKRIGVPNIFVEHGNIKELHKLCGMDEESIYQTLKSQL
jgi:1-deoxy-D-xylulose-5-phosphate synthase